MNDDDVDYNLSKVFGRDVKLMGAINMEEKSGYEECWPDIDGLAQR